MGYVIEPAPLARGGHLVQDERKATIVLVGCGGTGGFLAEAVCRLLIGRPARLYLVDMDRVEQHNVARQAFDRTDVGHYKAEVLANRLARRFGREVGYSVLPYDRDLHAQVFGNPSSGLRLLLGCVDNAAARRAIAATLDDRNWNAAYRPPPQGVWWVDGGNGRNAGQVLLGNVTRAEGVRGAFLPDPGVCRALPAPSLQRPDLLDTPPEPQPALDCAEAITAGTQGPTINQVVAAIMASYVEKLLTGTCSWMSSYFDLDDGTLRCVPADPKVVAGLVGLHVNAVVSPAPRP
ncbi:MAG: ThiF family adenylyltransferase [Chloroflexi bacterium]|nr:ThiF family adenylyltransferase [Chloroflexota bacterium]